MSNEQRDASLGVENLPQTELDSTPGMKGEQPAGDEGTSPLPGQGLASDHADLDEVRSEERSSHNTQNQRKGNS